MKTHQKALIVTTNPGRAHSLDELNIALSRGWRVVQMAPMGGAGVGAQDGAPELCFAALVIIERRGDLAAEVMELEQEEAAELLDEFVEGDGSSADLSEEDLDASGT